jgi:SAM-dependent methyltransferase
MTGRDRIDEEELGRTVQLLYDAFSLVESVGGSLSPYVPTQEYIVGLVLDLVEAAAAGRRAARGERGPPVYYEPGCGAGRVAARAAERGLYSVCLELDEYLAREAAERARRSPLLDVVLGDLSVFRPRRVDAVYAYLLPRAVLRVLEALRGLGAPVVSLDYPAEGDRGVLVASRLELLGRSLFAYES